MKEKPKTTQLQWKRKGNGDKPYQISRFSVEGERHVFVFESEVLLDLGERWRRQAHVRHHGGLPFDDDWIYHPNRYVQAVWDHKRKGWAIEITNYCCYATGDRVVIPWTKHQRWMDTNEMDTPDR